MARQVAASTQFVNLTNGRVAIVGASGLLTDDANFTYNTATQTLTVPNVSITGGIASSTFNSPTFVWPTRKLEKSAAGELLHSDNYAGIGNLIQERFARSTASMTGTLNDIARWNYNFVQGDSATGALREGRAQLYLTDQTGEYLAIEAKMTAGTVTVSLPNATFTGSVTSGALTSGRVAIVGTAGVITDDAGFTYSAATDVASLSGAVAVGTNSAQSGVVRVSNTGKYVSRNAANGADVDLFNLNANNQFELLSNPVLGSARQLETHGATDMVTNYEKATLGWVSGNTRFELNAAKGGSGVLRDIKVGGTQVLLGSGASLTDRWKLDANGHVLAVADNTYDIGASGATRPRNLYVAGTGAFGGVLTAPTAADGTNTTQVATTAFVLKGLRYNAVTYFGMDNTGTTDLTATVLGALNTIHTAGGGELYFPSGTYRFNGRILFPWTVDGGQTGGYMNSIRIRGDGSSQVMSSEPVGGTIFKFYDSSVTTTETRNSTVYTMQAQFDTRARGTLEICGVTFFNTSTSSTLPFFRTTGTVPFIHHCAFFGRTGAADTSSNIDPIVIGGTTRTSTLDDNACFSGYGGYISYCYFERCRSVRLQTYVNSFWVTYNSWGLHTGGGSTDASIVVDSGTETGGVIADAMARANVIAFNLWEMVNYKYAVRFDNYANANLVGGNAMWDAAVYDPNAFRYKVTGSFAGFQQIAPDYTDSCQFVDDSAGVSTNWTRFDGVINRWFSTTFAGADPLKVDAVPVSGGGLLLRASTTLLDYFRFGAPDIDTLTITREPHSGGGAARNFLQLSNSAGDSSQYIYGVPPVNGGNVYWTNINGNVVLMASGSNANAVYIGDNANVSALRYYNGDWTFGSSTNVIMPHVGPSAAQQHTLPAVTSDTIALVNATQTLAGKTLSGPTITGAVTGSVQTSGIVSTPHLISTSVTITAGSSYVVSRYSEVASGVTLEIGADADMEIL